MLGPVRQTSIQPGRALAPAPLQLPAVVSAEPLYRDTINRVSAREGVDPHLVNAVIRVESAYHANALSPKGAMGLMQLMPGTARQYGVQNAYDPVSNIKAGVRHLRSLLERLPVDLAIAAYNAGEAAVDKFNGIPPYRETQDYVARVLRAAGGYGSSNTTLRATVLYPIAAATPQKGAAHTVTRPVVVPWSTRLKAAAGPWRQGQAVRDGVPRLQRRSIFAGTPLP